MRQEAIHQLVGYDPVTEALVFERDFQPSEWDKVRSWLKNDASDPEYIYVYQLDDAEVRDITSFLGNRDAPALDYYIQCFAHA